MQHLDVGTVAPGTPDRPRRGDFGLPAASAALDFGADALEFQFGVRHVLGVPDQCPAEGQRFRHHLPKGAHPHPHHVDVPTVGVILDDTGDRFTQRQLMHRRSPPIRELGAGQRAHEHCSTPERRFMVSVSPDKVKSVAVENAEGKTFVVPNLLRK